MLLAIDIGNSSTKFGVFESSSLIDKFTIPTVRDYSVNELLFDRLQYIKDRFFAIDTIGIASVVPEVDETFHKALKELLNVTPTFLDHKFDFGIKIKYDPPESLGIDRLVNASAAVLKNGSPLIICSFGTATTIDAVNSGSEYLGGTISPGMRTFSESLYMNTSKLPFVPIQRPGSVIGNSTEASIKSGVFFGSIGLAEGIVRRMLDEFNEGESVKVIATGGFADLIAGNTDIIDAVDTNLTLDGIRILMGRQSA